MKKLLVLTAIISLWTLPAMAQDPGLQDSIIIGSAHVDSPGTFAFVPVYAVTDDSVVFYNFPLSWSSIGGIHGAAGTQYFPPITGWDDTYDTLMLAESYFRMIGFADLGLDTLPKPPILTNMARQHIMTLRFTIDANTPSQLVVIDTVRDPINGSILLGTPDGVTEITPAFVRGYISYGSTGVDDNGKSLPMSYNLAQNYPNPFNPTTQIDFAMPASGRASLEVYNLLGQKVRTVADRDFSSGEHSLTWDGRNDRGADVPSGVYFYRLTSASFVDTKRMILVR